MSPLPSSFSSPPPPPLTLKSLGLGYAIALAFGFLLLFSTILLSSYFCCRRHPPPPPPSDGVVLPRVIFVAENEDDEGENTNNVSVIGLDRTVINSYPKFRFLKKTLENNKNNNINRNNYDDGDNNNEGLMCSICLSEYNEGEMMRMMPDCKHYFHICCLDVWLKLNGSCPVCRNSPLPTPLSTPLAEVVPLSLFPDNRRRSSVIDSSSSF